MSRKLTSEEIAKLASRKGVRAVAVENFLASTPIDGPHFPYGYQGNAEMNLKSDAASYKWNAPTVKAIRDGLRMMFL